MKPRRWGQWRRLTPDQETAIRAAVVRGAHPRELAKVVGVSERTIYRTLAREKREALDVTVGDYRAVFEMTDDGPVQVTTWVAA